MRDSILIIGSGFIGDRLAEKLASYDYLVNIVDLKTGFDITNQNQVMEKIRTFEGSDVVIMAAISDLNVFEANPSNGINVNITGLSNVVLACSIFKKKLHYISTCCVYGNTDELPSTELSKTVPSEVYAACKLAGEWIVKGFSKSYGLQYTILRIATCYGPGMRSALAPAVFLNQALSGKPITIHGSGHQTRTYTYIDDEVNGIATVIRSGAVNQTFNVSTDEEVSVLQMVQIILEETNEVEHAIEYVPDRNGQTYVEQINANKLHALGWKPKTNFREGIQKTLSWMEKEHLTQI